MLGQWGHVWYQKACTQAGKFNGDLKTIFGAKPKPNKTKPKPKIKLKPWFWTNVGSIVICLVSKSLHSSWEI